MDWKRVGGILLIASLLCTLWAQPVSLREDVTVETFAEIANGAARMAHDPVSGNLFYSTIAGEIHQVDIETGESTLRYTTEDHTIVLPLGLLFMPDGALLVAGNNEDGDYTKGLIMKGVADGAARVWSTVVETELYPLNDSYNHLFNGMAISPDGKHLAVVVQMDQKD